MIEISRRERRALESVFPGLFDLASLEAPREACGLIEWDGTRMTVIGLENVADEPERSFLIPPGAQQRAMAAIEVRGTELWALWHSHPHQGARPSDRDRAFAVGTPGLRWVIVGLEPDDGSPEFWVGYP